MNETKIRWTDLSWNVWSGCTQVSPGCAYCYAKTMAERWGGRAFPNRFELTYRWHRLQEPLRLKQPHRIFVNSMSDMFFEPVPDEHIQQVFTVMNRSYELGQGHQFQVLTKRSTRMLQMTPHLTWTPNIWMGVSVENRRWTCRLDDLVQVPATVRFVSAEPLLGPLGDLSPWLPELQWMIVGGESGTHMNRCPQRWMDLAWAREIRNQCVEHAVPLFFKQSSGIRTEMGAVLDGERWEQYPRLPES
jgi:protein gp37